MSIWDDPDLRVGGDYVKFENVGDTVTGTVVAIRAQRWDDGKVDPQIILTVDGDEKTVTAGQVRLKAELATQRPEPGDLITITMTDVEKRAGGKTLKHFSVDVVRGGGSSARPSATSAPSSTAYTSEQIEAMRVLGMDVPA